MERSPRKARSPRLPRSPKQARASLATPVELLLALLYKRQKVRTVPGSLQKKYGNPVAMTVQGLLDNPRLPDLPFPPRAKVHAYSQISVPEESHNMDVVVRVSPSPSVTHGFIGTHMTTLRPEKWSEVDKNVEVRGSGAPGKAVVSLAGSLNTSVKRVKCRTLRSFFGEMS